MDRQLTECDLLVPRKLLDCSSPRRYLPQSLGSLQIAAEGRTAVNVRSGVEVADSFVLSSDESLQKLKRHC